MPIDTVGSFGTMSLSALCGVCSEMVPLCAEDGSGRENDRPPFTRTHHRIAWNAQADARLVGGAKCELQSRPQELGMPEISTGPRIPPRPTSRGIFLPTPTPYSSIEPAPANRSQPAPAPPPVCRGGRIRPYCNGSSAMTRIKTAAIALAMAASIFLRS